MRNRGLLFIGSLFILFGVISLVEVILKIDLERIFWPCVVILIGVWLLLRPRFTSPDSPVKILPIADIDRRGVWQVRDEEFRTFVGNIVLDLSQAEVPVGETTLRMSGFVGDIQITAPAEVGIEVSSRAFVTTGKFWQKEQNTFFTPVEETSPGYASAERKVRLDTSFFIADFKLKQAELNAKIRITRQP